MSEGNKFANHHTEGLLSSPLKYVITLLLLVSASSHAQDKAYVNDLDRSLTLNSLVIVPLVDNVSDVYAPKLTESLQQDLESEHRWNIKLLEAGRAASLTKAGRAVTPEDFESKPAWVQSILKSSQAEGMISGRIAKGPRGLYIKLALYVGAEGLPVGFETLNNYEGFELADLKVQMKILAKKLLAKLPYQAQILSRNGQLVTLSMGMNSGLRQGTELTVLQVIRINRHPKFKFITGTENLTLGKIRIEKAEESLSFASIQSERSPGVITTGAKLAWDQFVNYPNVIQDGDGTILPGLAQRGDAKTSFGEVPKEWKPEAPPTFGKVGFLFGLGSESINNTLISTTSSGSSSITPSLHVNGEMWFTTNWFANAQLESWVYTLSNGYTGSSPNTLNATTNKYSFNFGYNFLVDGDFYGPKFFTSLGYANFVTTIDGSSPTAFESTNYSGFNLGLGGEFPVGVEGWKFPLYIGGRLNYFLSPSMSEAPTSSGAGSSNSMSGFSALFNHRVRERLNVHAELDFDTLRSNFSGTGSRAQVGTSSSETLTTFAAGVEFLY